MERKFEFLEMHLVHGLPVDQAATFAGVHRATMYRWLGQYESIELLEDESKPEEIENDRFDGAGPSRWTTSWGQPISGFKSSEITSLTVLV